MPDFSEEGYGRPFVRPRGFFAELTNRLLPPPPPNQQVYEFGPIHKQMGLRHHLYSLLAVAAVLGCAYALYDIASWLFHSPLTLFITVFGDLPWYLGIPLLSAVCMYWWRLLPTGFTVPRAGGFFDKAAVIEEQWFREGAEGWTRW